MVEQQSSHRWKHATTQLDLSDLPAPSSTHTTANRPMRALGRRTHTSVVMEQGWL